MPLAFQVDLTSWYAFAFYVATAYLLWRAFGAQLLADARAVRRTVRPEPPEPPTPPPVYVSEQIAANISYADDEQGKRYVARISPMYEIHNGGTDYWIRDVTTGVRLRGEVTGGHQFDWYAGDIRPLKHAEVRDVEIPPELCRHAPMNREQEAFVFWARFRDVGGRFWEVWRDAHTRQVGEQLNPPPLDAPTR